MDGVQQVTADAVIVGAPKIDAKTAIEFRHPKHGLPIEVTVWDHQNGWQKAAQAKYKNGTAAKKEAWWVTGSNGVFYLSNKGDLKVAELLPYRHEVLSNPRNQDLFRVLCEGPKDADALAGLGFITSDFKTILCKEQAALFSGRDIVLIKDKDPPCTATNGGGYSGHKPGLETPAEKYVAKAHKLLKPVANRIAIVTMPGDNGIKDPAQWCAAHPGSWEEKCRILDELFNNALKFDEKPARPSTKHVDKGDKPVIEIVNGELPHMIDKAERVLLSGDFGLYQRSGMVVRPAMVPVRIADGKKIVGQQLITETVEHLSEIFMRSITWLKYDARANGLVRKDCPPAVAQTYLKRVGEWKLPFLSGLISAPTLRPDGSILDVPGYDEQTGLLFDPQGVEFPEIPEFLTKEDAIEAKNKLLHLVRSFAFVSDTDKSVWLSLAVTAAVRKALDTAPMHAINAPVAGTGKTKLVDVVSIMIMGRPCAAIPQGTSDEETEKRSPAYLLQRARRRSDASAGPGGVGAEAADQPGRRRAIGSIPTCCAG